MFHHVNNTRFNYPLWSKQVSRKRFSRSAQYCFHLHSRVIVLHLYQIVQGKPHPIEIAASKLLFSKILELSWIDPWPCTHRSFLAYFVIISRLYIRLSWNRVIRKSSSNPSKTNLLKVRLRSYEIANFEARESFIDDMDMMSRGNSRSFCFVID